jgi:hypothetical protein
MVDQARDAEAALAIAQGAAFPLVGPVAPGLYALGPLYYYLLAIPFWWDPSPGTAVLLIGLLNTASVYVAYRLGRDFWSPAVGLIGAALYAVFPMAILSSRVMWNPGFVPFFTLVAVYAMFHFLVRGKPWGLTVALAALACLLQVHLSGLALALVLVVAVALWRPPIPWRQAIIGLALAATFYAPYVAFEAGRGFQGVWDALRFAGTERSLDAGQAWISVSWAALEAPFTVPVAMAAVAAQGPARTAVTAAQYAELALLIAGLLWLLASLLRGWWRDGVMPRADALLALWMTIPLVTLVQKKQALMWYYFDILYPSQFLAIGLLVEGIAMAVAQRGGRRAVLSVAGVVVVSILASQGLFVTSLRRDVLEHGALRLPTQIGLRSPDPLWLVRDRGFIELMPARYKHEVTAAILAGSPMDRTPFYLTVHGSAFEDLIEDRGYFYHRLHRNGAAPVDRHYAVVRARDWPDGVDGTSSATGPFRVVPYRPRVRYAFWKYTSHPGPTWFGTDADDSSWPLVRLPARRLPRLDLYAQTPLDSWGTSPVYYRGMIVAEGRVDGLHLIIALRDLPPEEQRHRLGAFYLNGRPRAPVAVRSYLTAMTRSTEAVIEVGGALEKGENLVAFEVRGHAPAFDLDVYEVRSLRGSRR